MNASVARVLTASVCMLAIGCADSGTRSDAPDAGPGGVSGEADAGALSFSRPTDAGPHQLVAESARACAAVPIDVVRPMCAAGGWCWTHPLPQGNPLRGAIGFTDAEGRTTDFWAVGVLGTALRLRGGEWDAVATGTTVHLNGVWGSAPDDLWAVGDAGTTLHYDGTAWTKVDAHDDVSLRAVWGTGPRDVWAAGARGHVLHWDGSAWSRSPNPVPNDLNGLWGVRHDTRVNETKALWAVGDDGAQLKWDGSRWSILPPLHPYSTFAVFGTSPNNVWIGGKLGLATRYDGADWSTSSTRSRFDIFALGGTGPADIWAAGASGLVGHFDGTQWQTDLVGRDEDWRGVWACGPNSAWFVGSSGKVVQWTEDRSYTVRTKAHLDGFIHGGDVVEVGGISGAAPNDIWVTARTGLLHWDGVAWSLVPLTNWGRPYAVWTSGPNDVYAATLQGLSETHLVHWDGVAWTEPGHPIFEIVTGSDVALGGTGPSDVWLASPQGLSHYDGTSWTLADASVRGARVWTPALGEVWTVEPAHIHRYRSGTAVSFPSPGGKRFRDVWGPSSTTPALEAWAVGDEGALARWDGATWALVPSATDRDLHGVWGSSPADVWAAGDGVLLHYDGSAWTASYDVTTHRLGAPLSGGIWGSSGRDVWVTGARGTILHRQVP